MRQFFALIAAAGALGGCATDMYWQPVGGSRADGTVRLAIEYGMFESPRLDEAQAVAVATQRCRTWGYSGAQAFGAGLNQCTAYNGYGCARTMVTKEYQCTGGPSSN